MEKDKKLLLKKQVFENLLYRMLCDVDCVSKSDCGKHFEILNNDFGRTKVMKLLFFVCAASIEIDKDDNLFNIFDNWWALPLGHVEKDVQFMMQNNELNIFVVSNICTKFKLN